MAQGTNDNKTAPTVSNVGATSPTISEFIMNQHRGHALTRVGTFADDRFRVYEVWYCRNDHTLGIA